MLEKLQHDVAVEKWKISISSSRMATTYKEINHPSRLNCYDLQVEKLSIRKIATLGNVLPNSVYIYLHLCIDQLFFIVPQTFLTLLSITRTQSFCISSLFTS